MHAVFFSWQQVTLIPNTKWNKQKFIFVCLRIKITPLPARYNSCHSRKKHNYPRPAPPMLELSSGLYGIHFSYASHWTISTWRKGMFERPMVSGRRHILIFLGGDGTSETFWHVPCVWPPWPGRRSWYLTRMKMCVVSKNGENSKTFTDLKPRWWQFNICIMT